LTRVCVLEGIEHLMPLLSSKPLEHLLWIVEETRVRIRSQPDMRWLIR